MKNIINILLLVIVTITLSCSRNEGNFTISNESDFDIDSLYLIPDSKKQIIEIKKGEQVNLDIKMDEVKSDGSYLISFVNSSTNQKKSKSFGYYTNGYQMEDIINIRILNDTILISAKFDDIF
ncbi:hypothetical protein [uncultured Winogradskyella sp.]|uniref:hypothetical protein n=1 Tax=uncultured Winogradskyella sp. TaxID=395353 RepID=UPI002636127B|nr:hypothetical protein [uncultured Winogradskyella sp.]